MGMFVCFAAVVLIVESKQKTNEDFKAYDSFYFIGIFLAMF